MMFTLQTITLLDFTFYYDDFLGHFKYLTNWGVISVYLYFYLVIIETISLTYNKNQ